MDNTYKKNIIAMGIPALLALVIVVICTIFQKDIIRQFARFILIHPEYRKFLSPGYLAYADKPIVPVYMFITVFSAVIIFIATSIVVSSKNLKAKPGAGVALIICQVASVTANLIYYVAGGDKLIFGKAATLNCDSLSMVLSMLVSPLMMVFFPFFLVTVITFIVRASKLKANKS